MTIVNIVSEESAFNEAEDANTALLEALDADNPPTSPEVVSACALVCIATELRWKRIAESVDAG